MLTGNGVKTMPDREKIIKDNAIRGLQNVIEISGALVHLRKEYAKVILELLKEQEDTINELQNAYGYLQKQFFEAQDKLLKEQETVELTINEYGEAYYKKGRQERIVEKMSNKKQYVPLECEILIPVVRCKDCKRSKSYSNGEMFGCEFGNGLREPDWFCADGVREEQTAE